MGPREPKSQWTFDETVGLLGLAWLCEGRKESPSPEPYPTCRPWDGRGGLYVRCGPGLATAGREDRVRETTLDCLYPKSLRSLSFREREYSVYVRTMSTNQPHPETSAPEFLFVGSREIDRYEVQIAGDTAYMFIFRNLVEDPLPGFDESNMVVVWNWKTGVRLLVCVKIITASEDTHR